jgi:hypothetical protein
MMMSSERVNVCQNESVAASVGVVVQNQFNLILNKKLIR